MQTFAKKSGELLTRETARGSWLARFYPAPLADESVLFVTLLFEEWLKFPHGPNRPRR